MSTLDAKRFGLSSALLCLAVGCREEVAAPPPPNPVAASVSWYTVPARAEIGEVYEIAVEKGVMSEIRLDLLSSLPAELGGRVVQPSPKWPLMLVLYPPGGTRLDDGAFYNVCPRYPEPGSEGVPYLGARHGWDAAGFQGAPSPPKEYPRNVVLAWTFIASPDTKAGEWDYELLAYPTSAPTGPNKGNSGDPVVMKSGRLRFIEAAHRPVEAEH